ncbi:phosphoribosylamine--glycine ligase [Burkholderia ubonensis]|uniref:phosphoribosylamine--glycine ligase n=1 Tax=Burkholderia ubonensis TaxID=101571 RepID=UPI00076DE826|nr:phosphoribosylglycinamide synthetase C domain-containing protein [Burkholderia ubonensis]KVH43117.1 hypothetical protein WJ38_28150 [Burkholderia ubonensis]
MTRYMLFGEGTSKEQAFCEQCWRLTSGDELLCCITGRNLYLESSPNTSLVSGVSDAIEIALRRGVQTVILLSVEQLEAGNYRKFHEAGFQVFGLPETAISLETSKSRAKAFMKRYEVASAPSVSFGDPVEARQYLLENWRGGRRFVVKADGYLSDIKFSCCVPDSLADALVAMQSLFEHLESVGAQREVVIEERVEGREFSLHLLVDGTSYKVLPMVRDYKRIFRGDRGPNTAGIGSVAVAKEWDGELLDQIKTRIIEPTMRGMREEAIDYRYILYVGVMVTDAGPVALEYNVRPGNPEFPTLLALLRTNGLNLVSAMLNRRLSELALEWEHDEPYSVAVTTTAPGYPFSDEGIGEPISGLGLVESEVWPLAENICANPLPTVSSGRVLTIVGRGSSFAEARTRVYRNIDKIQYNGLYCRRDIGELSVLE